MAPPLKPYKIVRYAPHAAKIVDRGTDKLVGRNLQNLDAEWEAVVVGAEHPVSRGRRRQHAAQLVWDTHERVGDLSGG